MPRIARAVAIGHPHHVTQRGNFGVKVFEADDDRRQYLAWFGDYARRYGLRVWAYCLMPNHVHFIVVPGKPESLAQTFNQTHMRHAQARNRAHGRRGHLWQGRFYSCILEEAHLLAAVRYVERNPVRARMVRTADAYAWSSASAHVRAESDPLLDPESPLPDMVGNWLVFLGDRDDGGWCERLRLSTSTGRPFGSDGFVARLESRLRRSLAAKPHGRPPKDSGK